ncbi:MAG: cysteine desulfurase [Cyclobacteriaceae bacterium]|nr:cysteine desulfurase [Cyclobacteriaceae bacterium]
MEAAIKQSSLDIDAIRAQFPVLDQEVNGYPLTYFDNAATSQKPIRVIEALNQYYSAYNSNIHRGVHSLAEKATNAYEATRVSLQKFINSGQKEEIIFTKGTSESINLVAATYGRQNIAKGDEIIITGLEHHSNIVPWQMLCEEKEAVLKVVPISDKGEIDLEDFNALLSDKTKIVSVAFASNALGTINPVKEIIEAAHKVGAVVLLDSAQAVAHLEVDVQSLDCDFLAASAHKMYGPTGVGFLYGKQHLLEEMPPYQGGGEMIKEVTFEKTTYNDIPFKFEAGTPNIADIIALNEAIGFINDLGKENIRIYEDELLKYATEKLEAIDKVKLIGTAKHKVGVLSFIIEGMHPFDVGMMLDARGIAVRTGHHCTMPLMQRFELEGTIRASFAVYNTFEEIDTMVASLQKITSRIK